MTSLHRSLPSWVWVGNAVQPFTLRLHYTTARPLEVRLRVPLHLVDPDWPHPLERPAWVSWAVERDMLKGSAWVVGTEFGMGDVRIGQRRSHWMAHLHRAGRCVTIGTHLGWVREVVNLVDGISPPAKVADLLDIDGVIARLLETSA